MCSVAHCLAIKILPLSRELFVIRWPKTQTASFRIIIVQRNLCFKVPLAHGLIIYLVLPFQVSYFGSQFPQTLTIPTLWVTSLSSRTPIKLSVCPHSPIMSALPLCPLLNLKLADHKDCEPKLPVLEQGAVLHQG
jgi:hypothetical protein